MAQRKKIATKKRPKAAEIAPTASGFSIKDKIDAAKTAQRFGLTETDVHTELTRVQGDLGLDAPERVGGEVVVEATVKKSELHNYLLSVYDKLARSYSFTDMATMMATAHVTLVSRSITHPESFGKEGLKALDSIGRMLYPAQRASIKRTLPPNETKDDVLARIFNRLSTTSQNLKGNPPSGNVAGQVVGDTLEPDNAA